MKPVLALLTTIVLLLAASCSQSPEKLLAEANKYHDNKKYEEASILYQKVLAKDKTNAEAYYRLGLNALEQGKGNEAAQALRRAVDLKPSNTDATVKLAEIYLLAYQGSPKAGKSLSDDLNQLDAKLLQQNPNSFEGLRIQGLIAAIVNKDAAKAEESFSRANAIQPYSPALVDAYSQVLLEEKKTDQAIALITGTLEHNKTWEAGYNRLLAVYESTGQKDKLEALFQQHLAADPKSASAILGYAYYRLRNGDFAGAEQLMQRLSKDPKTFPGAPMYLGDFYVRARKLDQATASYQQGKKDDPKDAVAYDLKLIELQAATNHLPEAARMAKDLAEKNPTSAPATELYAELLLRTTAPAGAAQMTEQIKKMVDANPANTVLRFDLAKGYLASNDRAKCLASLQQVVGDAQKDNQKTGRAQPALLPAELLEARIYQEQGGLDGNAKALELASSIINSGGNKKPDLLFGAKIVRDRVLISTGKAPEAQTDLEQMLKLFPNMLEAHLLLGDAHLAQRQLEAATLEYEAAAKGTPPDRRALIGIQNVKLLSGHAVEAVQAIQELAAKSPADLSWEYELARFQDAAASAPSSLDMAARKQLLQQAADNYKKILAVNPSAGEMWMRLGAIQEKLSQSDAALASFEQAAAVNPKNADALLDQALLLEVLNRKKEAVDMYNKVLNITPDNPLALNNLAMITAEGGGNLDQAQTYAERAKKGAPDSPDVADTLGYVYLRKNLNTQAAEIFRQNVQQHPQNPAFHFHLAMALLKTGDKQGAREQASKALQGAPPNMQSQIKTFMGQIG
jgi:tetratricopeptide (TPR) repeat protein